MAGSLVCVGLGMAMGAHITPISRSYIEHADVVFSLVSNGVVELWVKEMNSNSISLQQFYTKKESRNVSYKNMVNAMVEQVLAGKKVVGAFYGHPGVFAKVPHEAIKVVRELGFESHMEPGISAEDCLFADLNIDPGKVGCQQFEASQFMFYQRVIDPSAYLILWQVAVAGDTTVSKDETGIRHRRVLLELLQYHGYNLEHKVILYESPTLAINQPRIEFIPLGELLYAALNQQTTLVIPPFEKLLRNDAVLSRLNAINSEEPKLRLIN